MEYFYNFIFFYNIRTEIVVNVCTNGKYINTVTNILPFNLILKHRQFFIIKNNHIINFLCRLRFIVYVSNK